MNRQSSGMCSIMIADVQSLPNLPRTASVLAEIRRDSLPRARKAPRGVPRASVVQKPACVAVHGIELFASRAVFLALKVWLLIILFICLSRKRGARRNHQNILKIQSGYGSTHLGSSAAELESIALAAFPFLNATCASRTTWPVALARSPTSPSTSSSSQP